MYFYHYHRRILFILTALCLSFPLAWAEEGSPLYDNLDEPLPFRGRSLFSTSDLKAVLAQPFTTGEHGNICSVAFPVARFGSPSGIVPVEIWDDADGEPGKKVATVGEFDIATLALEVDAPGVVGGQILRFDTEITGLTPYTVYYLLTDDTATDVTGLSKTYLVQTTPGNEGTNESGRLLGSPDGGASWEIVGNVQGGRNYRLMEILECPPASDEGTLYDNFPDPLPRFIQGGGDGVNNSGPPGPSELQPLAAQPFLTNDWGTVDEVTVYIVGTPEVGGTIDVVVTEDVGGFPGETIATLGTIDLATLTVWEAEPILGDLLTYEANLIGLEPNTRYYVGFDITNMDPIGDRFPNATFFNLFREEDDGTNGAGLNMAGPFGEWKPLSDFVGHAKHMLMRVTTSPPPAIVIEPTDNGSVATESDINDVVVGDDITLTAQPNEGYEFAKWLYGDKELTSNPVTITITEPGITLTPEFAQIAEPQPLNIDIAAAVVVSWDSQSDTTYQIHRSMDMENWELAVNNIEGTGERLTHCFIREETEVFYRVEVAP